MKKEQKISAIKDGSVIDHLPARAAFKVIDMLSLKKSDNVVSIATNLKSKKTGKKGIIKVGGKTLTQSEVDKISIIAPNATVSIIKNYEVKEKIKVKVPGTFNNIIKCSNPNCITNNERIDTVFYVTKKDPIKVRCHYCERGMQKEDIELI